MGQMTREVSWGDALVVASFRSHGGVKVAVDRIHAAIGGHIGSRATFTKFLHVDDPSMLTERDMFRVWLLIAALGEEPDDWGIPNSVVPPVMAADLPGLKEVLRACRDSNPKPSDSYPAPLRATRHTATSHVVVPDVTTDAAA